MVCISTLKPEERERQVHSDRSQVDDANISATEILIYDMRSLTGPYQQEISGMTQRAHQPVMLIPHSASATTRLCWLHPTPYQLQ